MTEPEQWAVELWNRAADAADGCATQSFGDDAKAAALTIQRAFEERERKLREALEWIRNHAIKLRKGTDDWFELVEFEAMATQALKETPDAQ